jgi:hypothetical protein
MRTFRVSMVGVLIAGGFAVLAPVASASVRSASKTCQSAQRAQQESRHGSCERRRGRGRLGRDQ